MLFIRIVREFSGVFLNDVIDHCIKNNCQAREIHKIAS